jgi:hypothetical protein|nr:hypothetical protein [Kofleriaceae bacterium]
MGLRAVGLAIALAACAPEIATPAEQQRAGDRVDADRVAAVLARLPGAVAASAAVRRVDRDPLAPVTPRGPAGSDATMIVVVATADADDGALAGAARAIATADGLPAPRVAIARTARAAAPPAELARVGPFAVARESAAALRATLLALLAAIAAAAAYVAARYRRRGNSAQ